MNDKQGFRLPSSRQNVDLPTNDETPPDVYMSEGDSVEEGSSNQKSDPISVEALIHKYTSHSRDTFPGESCELVAVNSVEDLTAEDSENKETKVVPFNNAGNAEENDRPMFPSSPATVQFANDGEDTLVPRRNDTSEAPGEETFEEGSDLPEKLHHPSMENRQEQDVSANPVSSRLKSLMSQMNRQTVDGKENNIGGENEETRKKKVSWQVGETKAKTAKKAAASVFKGSLASTVTTIAGLKRWKLKVKQDTQSDFEKYPGHLKVVQEHLRQEKTETPLTIRQDVKKEVLPILANIVKAYKKELVGEHRLLREATLKYERLKSELQDAFL